MTETLHTIVLKNLSELFAAVPHVVGYVPRNSLVLFTLRGRGARSELDLVTVDVLPSPAEVGELAQRWIEGPLRSTGTGEVFLLAVGDPRPQDAAVPAEPRDERSTDHGPPGSPPHADVIAALETAFREVGVAVVHAAWTAEIRSGQPWICYERTPCVGEISDPAASPVGVATTISGRVTYGSRAELSAVVASEAEDVLARRSAKLDALASETGQERGTSARPRRDGEVVFAALRRCAAGAALTEDDLLEVLLALSDSRVRDLALAAALDGELAKPALDLWMLLVRMAPQPELAEVASLVAVTAYVRGDGALAAVALDRIEQSRPEHQLGLLLRRALSLAIPVEDLERIVREAAEDARVQLEEESW